MKKRKKKKKTKRKKENEKEKEKIEKVEGNFEHPHHDKLITHHPLHHYLLSKCNQHHPRKCKWQSKIIQIINGETIYN